MSEVGRWARQRGVSDLLGFTLVFGIIITSVTAVWFVGIGALEEVRDEAHATSAEQSTIELAETMEAVGYNGITRRDVSLALSGDGLTTDQAEFNVTLQKDPSATPPYDSGFSGDTTHEIGTLTRRTKTEAAYAFSGGAVFATYRDGGILKRTPVMRCQTDGDPDTTNIAQIRLLDYNGEIFYSDSREATLVLRAGPSMINTTSAYDEVHVNVENTNNPSLWEEVFLDQGWESNSSPNTYSCGETNALDRAVIHVSTVNVSTIN
jgi:hypothetical protein